MPDERFETHLPSLASTPATARAVLRAALQSWELERFGAVTELLADELVSNVVRHVGQPMTLRARWFDERIRIEVDDPSTRRPVLRRVDLDSVTGRGIALVDALALRGGTDVHDGGKTVWFELGLTPGARVSAERDAHDGGFGDGAGFR